MRLLQYYDETGFNGHVCIGDSSNSDHLEKTRNAVKKVRRFRVSHITAPNLKVHECLASLMPYIDTPYATFLPDDDFLVTTTVKECIEFLKGNPKYSGATGRGIGFNLKKEGAFGPFHHVQPFYLRSLESERASERLLMLGRNYYVANYAIRRSEQFCKGFISHEKMKDTSIGAELFPSFLLAVQGKIKQFDKLLVVRHFHPTRYLLPDFFDWMTSPDWRPSFEVAVDFLAEELCKQDDISLEQAKIVANKAVSAYLVRILKNQWETVHETTGENISSFAKRVVRSISFLPNYWHIFHSFLQSGQLTLPALLRKSSSYHKDFMTIHRVVTDATNKGGSCE